MMYSIHQLHGGTETGNPYTGRVANSLSFGIKQVAEPTTLANSRPGFSQSALGSGEYLQRTEIQTMQGNMYADSYAGVRRRRDCECLYRRAALPRHAPPKRMLSNRALLLAGDFLQAGNQVSTQIGFRSEIFDLIRVRKLPHKPRVLRAHDYNRCGGDRIS